MRCPQVVVKEAKQLFIHCSIWESQVGKELKGYCQESQQINTVHLSCPVSRLCYKKTKQNKTSVGGSLFGHIFLHSISHLWGTKSSTEFICFLLFLPWNVSSGGQESFFLFPVVLLAHGRCSVFVERMRLEYPHLFEAFRKPAFEGSQINCLIPWNVKNVRTTHRCSKKKIPPSIPWNQYLWAGYSQARVSILHEVRIPSLDLPASGNCQH